MLAGFLGTSHLKESIACLPAGTAGMGCIEMSIPSVRVVLIVRVTRALDEK